MTLSSLIRHSSRTIGFLAAAATAACGDTTPTGVPPTAETLQLTPAMVTSLDSTALAIKGANSSNPELQSLVDSALRVLTAGINAKHLTLTTDLTTAPLYFVGIHRVFSRPSGSSSSTWTVVGMDDPSKLGNLVEVGGFAQVAGSTAPSSVSGTIGVAGNIGNALLLQVGGGGSVSEWRVNSGTASFASDAGGAACPNFQPTAIVACSIETMHVHFTVSGSSGASGSRQASIPADVDVPAMRLTYTLP